jgi:hypothetical protein
MRGRGDEPNLGGNRPEEEIMNRLMVVARLNDGAHEEAEKLLRQGPPFDVEELGFHRHAAYLTATEIVFLFEAPEVEWIVNDIVDDPVISTAFGAWEKLIDGPPRLAHERFYWSRDESSLGMGLGV